MRVLLILLFFITHSFSINSQTIFGKWKTIDDETGLEKAIVEIYNKNGKAYAKILEILEKGKENSLCKNCKGLNKNKPIKGLIIIDGLTQKGDEWTNALILEPKTGKTYKCYITLENTNTLKVRGYIGFALIGRTQFWQRVTN